MIDSFKFSSKLVSTPLLLCLTLQGCVTTDPKTGQNSIKETFKQTFANDDPCANNARNIGIVAGAILGGIVGNKVADNKTTGTLLGLGIGGALGAFIGSEVDKRQCELSKIQKKYNLEMEVTPLAVSVDATPTSGVDKESANRPETSQNVGLSVSVVNADNKPQFGSGSDELQPEAKQHFGEIAKQYSATEQAAVIGAGKTEEEKKKIFDELRKKRILLIGHTDDTGNTRTNAELSEKRAKAVAKLFKSTGIEESQLYYQGAGETFPIADNATPEGRAKNRRVEIVDLTNEDAFNLYLQNRRAKTEYYRAVEAADKVDASPQASDTPPVVKMDSAPIKTAEKPQQGKKKKPAVVAKKTEKKAVVKETIAANADKGSTVTKIKETVRSWIDFGGSPANQENAVVNLGEVAKPKPKFTLISEAQASGMGQISSCYHDRPRNSGAVKSLKDGREYATNEHLPGLNGRSWHDTVGGNLVVLNRVAVLRDGLAPANLPDLKVYANYNSAKNRNPKPDVSITPSVNTYHGNNGLLYRVFAQGDHGVQCMDVLMPLDSSGTSKAGKVVYGSKGSELVADFKPTMIR